MDRNAGSVRLVRMALFVLVVLSLALVVALAAPSQADAHQTAGRTLIYVDGELVRNTTDDHFTFERRLSPGCHTVEVVQKRGGEVVSSSIRRFCSDEPTKPVVKVDHGSVSFSTYTINSTSNTRDGV